MSKQSVVWAGLLCGLLLIWRYEDTSKHVSKPPTTKPAPKQPDTKPAPKKPDPPCPH